MFGSTSRAPVAGYTASPVTGRFTSSLRVWREGESWPLITGRVVSRFTAGRCCAAGPSWPHRPARGDHLVQLRLRARHPVRGELMADVRYTGISLGYQVGAAIIGGPGPW